MTADFADRSDFDDAARGLIDPGDPVTVTAADGRVVYDLQPYGFLNADCPETVNPSLWRQAQLVAQHGLFEVSDGIYQIRGFDLSNMTLIEGDAGVIVVDPLVSGETAAAGLALYRNHRGDRPVVGVIYTHSHGDHFGGVLGVLPDGRGDVPVLAPQGFLAEAVSENVYAGAAMIRRGNYMYGLTLTPSADGQVGTGLGVGGSSGTVGLIAPTLDITNTGQQETIDGVRIVFQLTPGTEAPAEMNFHLPDRQALCMAENASHTLHNLLTLRGAQVRDPRIWAHYLDEAIELFADGTDVAFGSHHWPTWGRQNIVEYLSQQRDLYAYLHDQTVRLMNTGLTGIEIAEEMELPPALDAAWHARGYYGSVSHNVKAIYQRYLGWFDGHPSSLWQHPPKAAAERYVETIGGLDVVVEKARGYMMRDDYRFAAELLKHAVFADPDHAGARTALAETYDHLGHGAENATWRNFYLTGAKELRGDITPPALDFGGGMAAALTHQQIIDTIAIRINGPRASADQLTIEWRFTDAHTIRTTLSNGALIQTAQPRRTTSSDLTITLSKIELLGLIAGQPVTGLDHDGDPGVWQRLIGYLDQPDPAFAIVTP